MDSKKWMHPQTVPRGFLRLYILLLLARRPETGYSIMQTIEQKTEGLWRPGPGTVYPLLRSLVKEQLAEVASTNKKAGTISYTIAQKGRKELESMQLSLGTAGRREQVMMRLFVDLLPAASFATSYVGRSREMLGIFKEKVLQIPQPERDALLRELRVVMENQLLWIDSQIQLTKAHGA